MAVYSISKTSFLKFEQCNKAFFFYKNHPYLRDKLSVDKQLTFKRGHEVGFYAQQLFPGGVDVSLQTKGVEEAAALTSKLISENTKVIYEATFVFNAVLIMADILVLEDGKYMAYEVKSSLKVSENYLKDAYLQYYVLKNCLPTFDDLFLVTLNPDYVLEGDPEPKKMFRRRSVKIKAEENFAYFDHRLKSARDLLEQNVIPNTPIGKQCFRPYQCDFFGTCWKETIHEQSLFNLPMVDKHRAFEWHEQGLRNISDLSDELLGKKSLVLLREAFMSGKPVIDHEKITSFLDKISTPVASMDMEIWSAAIPQMQGTKPFEQTPFLVSFFDGENFHSFLTEHTTDERRLFAEKLIELSANYATILVYDRTMEVLSIDNLSKRFPDLRAGLDGLKNKLSDIFDIFLNLWYYDPRFKNSFSLKVVSSVLDPELKYPAIGSGLEAMGYYEALRRNENEIEKENLRNDLLTYCNTDAIATYRLWKFLATVGK